jgi:hypothetical protein
MHVATQLHERRASENNPQEMENETVRTVGGQEKAIPSEDDDTTINR